MRKRILIIDDSKGIRDSFTLALEDTNYLVHTSESGEKGFMMEKENKYDLIFLDLKMPGWDGIKTLRELRKIDETIPIYIVTAFYKEFFNQLKAAREEGLQFEILSKPIDSTHILSVTRDILELQA
jgi:DNA-binding NtrC family response regulator